MAFELWYFCYSRQQTFADFDRSVPGRLSCPLCGLLLFTSPIDRPEEWSTTILEINDGGYHVAIRVVDSLLQPGPLRPAGDAGTGEEMELMWVRGKTL